MQTTDLNKRLTDFLSDQHGTDSAKFQLTSEGRTVCIEFDRIESLGCQVKRVSCKFETATNHSAEELVGLSEQLAEKLSYLEEPIRVIEIDESEQQVQLRSSPPQIDQKIRRYFELNRTNQEIRLCRYEKSVGSPRQPICSVLTHDILKRLASDLMQS